MSGFDGPDDLPNFSPPHTSQPLTTSSFAVDNYISPWGNFSQTLAAASQADIDAVSYTSTDPPPSSHVQQLNGYDQLQHDELSRHFHLTIEDVDESPSHHSSLEFDTRSSNGRSGVSPEQRASVNSEDIMSIDDQAAERETVVTNQGVRRWLHKSTTFPLQQVSDASHIVVTEPFPDFVRATHSDAGSSSSRLNSDSGDEDVFRYRHGQSPGQPVPQTQADPTGRAHPWIDKPESPEYDGQQSHPFSSTAAIERFLKQARDIETASWTATLGSRRRSESDIDSLFSFTEGSIKDSPSQRQPNARQGRSLFQRLRSPARLNPKKRKEQGVDGTREDDSAASPTEPRGPFPQVRTRIGSWTSPLRPKSPQPEQHPQRQLTRQGSNSSHGPLGSFKNVVRRRSGSELSQMWQNLGGPPIPLPRPNNENNEFTEMESPRRAAHAVTWPLNQMQHDEDEDDGSPKTVISAGLGILQAPSSGHPQDLRNHIKLLNVNIEEFLLDRLAKEQHQRYQRLAAWRSAHEEQIKTGKCTSGRHCNVLGEPEIWQPNRNSSNPHAPQVTFIIDPRDGLSDLDGGGTDEHRFEKAQIPEGIPLPPVQSLPAQFECTLCFRVKKFDKPSDWTKHVHEDLQPFTCTFKCGDAKSFKRKADWQRHENERHRQLEKWVCQEKDCTHVCFRKDNFVQHLVREHRYPEPRSKAQAGRNEITDPQIARLVVECRRDTTNKPSDEYCRFCGRRFSDWKKLTAHFAKHLEQISLPLIELVNQTVPSSVSRNISIPQNQQTFATQSDVTANRKSAPPMMGHNVDQMQSLSPVAANFTEVTQDAFPFSPMGGSAPISGNSIYHGSSFSSHSSTSSIANRQSSSYSGVFQQGLLTVPDTPFSISQGSTPITGTPSSITDFSSSGYQSSQQHTSDTLDNGVFGYGQTAYPTTNYFIPGDMTSSPVDAGPLPTWDDTFVSSATGTQLFDTAQQQSFPPSATPYQYSDHSAGNHDPSVTAYPSFGHTQSMSSSPMHGSKAREQKHRKRSGSRY